MKASSHMVAGIDVGGTKKGFHAVALREETVVAKLATSPWACGGLVPRAPRVSCRH